MIVFISMVDQFLKFDTNPRLCKKVTYLIHKCASFDHNHFCRELRWSHKRDPLHRCNNLDKTMSAIYQLRLHFPMNLKNCQFGMMFMFSKKLSSWLKKRLLAVIILITTFTQVCLIITFLTNFLKDIQEWNFFGLWKLW